MLAERIKRKHLAEELGKSASWITNKLNCDTTTTTSRGFTQGDIDQINHAIEKIGRKLIRTTISSREVIQHEAILPEKTTVEQLKTLSTIIRMSFIYETKLRKTASWYKDRMARPEKYRFKKEDIAEINWAIREIGHWLLSVEFTL